MNNDTGEDISDYFERFRKKEKDKRASALRFMVNLMRANDLKYYAAKYSGEGDSGSINFACLSNETLSGDNFDPTPGDILQKIKDIKVEDKEFPESIQPYSHDGRQPVHRTLMDVLEHCAEYLLPSGYEINDGGQGVLVLNAETGEVEIEAGSNYTDVSFSTLSYDIGE